jgi:hypothetical protein
MIARPKMTEQDKQMIMEFQEQQKRLSGYSATEEIEKAQSLLNAGTIDQSEFNRLKERALA